MAVSRGSASPPHPTTPLSPQLCRALTAAVSWLCCCSAFSALCSPEGNFSPLAGWVWQTQLPHQAICLTHAICFLCHSYSSPEKCTKETIPEDS